MGIVGFLLTDLVPLAEDCLKLEQAHPHGARFGTRRWQCGCDSLGRDPIASFWQSLSSRAGHRREATRAFRAQVTLDSIAADKALPWIEHRISLELAPSQKRLSVLHSFQGLVITGGRASQRPPSSTRSCVFSQAETVSFCAALRPGARPSA